MYTQISYTNLILPTSPELMSILKMYLYRALINIEALLPRSNFIRNKTLFLNFCFLFSPLTFR